MLGRSGMTSNTSSGIRLGGNQIGKSNSQLSAAAAAAAASNQAGVGGGVGAIGEKKRLKVQFIQPSTDKTQNLSFQINPKTWPNLRIADVIEISPGTGASNSLVPASSSAQLSSQGTPVTSSSSNTSAATDEEATPFLVHVAQTSFNENIPPDTICIDKAASVAPFSIKGFSYVQATVVDRSQVTLDLVELIFKEQYLNGHDMLRIKKSLERTCVYLKKSVEFCSMKSMVKEMWAKSKKDDSVTWVTCGYVGDKTRLVFRSQSAMCTIYIQMSREMWEFDVNGEMYHEKAINFLGELFTNWKNQACSHDVTIALFSRIFYTATNREQFPPSIRTQIQQDNKGRFYEDFYRVVYQNERYDDWTPTLIILKRLIKEYRDYILNYHRRNLGAEGEQMPEGQLSSAAEGNFLQTLNLSSSVFERQFVDRPFDRTGMMSLVITPGNGIYEVSRELTKITKERVIDNGIGSDLVCLGEQPLHAVPLFKYTDTSDNYCIPTWINLSFYKSSEIVRFCNSTFLPCSKIKMKKHDIADQQNLLPEAILPGYKSLKVESYLKSLEDTDDIFEDQSSKKAHSESFSIGSKRSTIGSKYSTSTQNMQTMSTQRPVGGTTGGVATPSKSVQTQPVDEFDADEDEEFDLNSENKDANPFMPSKLKKRMSTQRRPWAHIFPLSEDGSPIFPNVFPNEKPSDTDVTTLPSHEPSTVFKQRSINTGGVFGVESSSSLHNTMAKVSPDSAGIYLNNNRTSLIDVKKRSIGSTSVVATIGGKTGVKSNWEVSNFDETMAIVKTGVAWKSLTTPACLPLTTDFSPSQDTWHKKFVRSSDYTLLLDVIREQYQYTTNQNTKKIKMTQVFQELMGHRLAMGFQLVVARDYYTKKSSDNNANGGQSNNNSGTQTPGSGGGGGTNSTMTSSAGNKGTKNQGYWFTTNTPNYYKLSLGRMFHELYLQHDHATNSHSIKVEIYTPKEEPSKDAVIEYRYRFQVPDSRDYNVSFCEISRKNIRALKQIWNPIDCYICIQGNGSLLPTDLARFWRQRIYMIPLMYVSTKSINETSQENHQQQRSDSEPRSFSSSSTLTEIVHTQESTLQHYLNSFPNLVPSQIPQSMLPGARKTIKCDIYTRKSPEELKFLRDYYFIKFMEGLNKLTRADERRSYSKSTLAYLEANSGLNSNSDNFLSATSVISNAINQLLVGSSAHTAVNPLQASGNSGSMALLTQTPGSVGSTGSSASKTQTIPTSLHKPAAAAAAAGSVTTSEIKKLVSPKIWLLPAVQSYKNSVESSTREEIVNYMNREYKEAMTSKSTGIPFMQDKMDIPKNCFISAEAVWWCIDHIEDVLNEADAICFMQIACDFELVKHISNQPKIFIHGFYLYYILTEQSSDHLYTRDYCEVGYVDIDFTCTPSTTYPSTSPAQAISRPSLVEIKDLLPESTNTLPVVANDLFKAYLKMFNQYSLAESNKSPETVTKQVNVDVDPNRKSEDRIEWASAVYRSHYHPLCAFELEVQWNIATGSLLSELVLGWAKLAKLNNLHIVAAPVDPFATPNTPNSDPLRGPIFVKLNLNCLTAQDESVLFENYIEQKYKSCFDEIFSDKYNIKEDESKILSYDDNDDDEIKDITSSSSDSNKTELKRTASYDGSRVEAVNQTLIEFLNKNEPKFEEFLFRKFLTQDNVRLKMRELDFVKLEFLEFIEYERTIRLQYFQEAILEKFGFVRNAAVVKTIMSDDYKDQPFFLHSSGGMFVMIPNYYNSDSMRSRHSSSATTTNTVVAHKSGIKNAISVADATGSLATASSSSLVPQQLDFSSATSNKGRPILQYPNRRDRSITESGDMLQRLHAADDELYSRTAATINAPSSSYISSASSAAMLSSSSSGRDRSNTKTQPIQYLKLNERFFLRDEKEMIIEDSNKLKTNSGHNTTVVGSFKEGQDTLENSPSNAANAGTSSLANSMMAVDDLNKAHEAICINKSKWTLHQERMSFKKAMSSTSSFVTSQPDKDDSAPSWSDNEAANIESTGGVIGRKMPNYIESELFIGFWWSWNFMLGKKWRTQNTGDEAFQDNMLADFRQFCANQDGRLKSFFEQSKPFLQ